MPMSPTPSRNRPPGDDMPAPEPVVREHVICQRNPTEVGTRPARPPTDRQSRTRMARQVYLHQRLVETERPWEHEGPLHWRREVGGWRVVGSYLPPQDWMALATGYPAKEDHCAHWH